MGYWLVAGEAYNKGRRTSPSSDLVFESHRRSYGTDIKGGQEDATPDFDKLDVEDSIEYLHILFMLFKDFASE